MTLGETQRRGLENTIRDHCCSHRLRAYETIPNTGIVAGSSEAKISKLNGWFLSTKGQVDSKDLRRHLDSLLEALAAHCDQLLTLQACQASLPMSLATGFRSLDIRDPRSLRSRCECCAS
jgi:hypothetical protein